MALWEYHQMTPTEALSIGTLNDLGRQQWELISVLGPLHKGNVKPAQKWRYIFKRAYSKDRDEIREKYKKQKRKNDEWQQSKESKQLGFFDEIG